MEQRGEPNEGQRTMMQPMASESLQRINTDISQDVQVYPTTVLEPSSAIPLSMPRRQSSMTSQLNNWAAGSESDEVEIDYNKFVGEYAPETMDGA